MHTKILSWKTGNVNFEPYYPGLQLKYYRKDNITSGYIISKTGQEIGHYEMEALENPKTLRLYQLKLSPDFFGQGIGTAMLRYLCNYAADTSNPCLTLSSQNYAFLHSLKKKLPDNVLLKTNLFSKWQPLERYDFLEKNNQITVDFTLDNQNIQQVDFKKNIFGDWKPNNPYLLFIERSGRVLIYSRDKNRENPHNAQFYFPNAYEVLIPASLR